MLAEHDRETDTETETFVFDVSDIHVHGLYESNKIVDVGLDMAMVKLAKEINFDSTINIRPICLPTDRSKLYVGRTVTVSGWGLTEQDKLSPILKELDLKVDKQKNCELGLNFLADNLQQSSF